MKIHAQKVNVQEEQKLKWPTNGWERTLIGARQAQASWKKPFRGYRDVVVKELERIGATDVLITYNVQPEDRMDPGVAVYFSIRPVEDYAWQSALGIESPAPTLQEIDEAFRHKAMQYHPDRNSDPTCVEIYRSMVKHRERAKAWVLGTHTAEHDLVIACDRFTEGRWNMNAIRLAMAAFRQLDRVGIPGILERTFKGFKAGLPAHEVKNEPVHA